jgi:hypothetical protein
MQSNSFKTLKKKQKRKEWIQNFFYGNEIVSNTKKQK